MTTQTDTDTTDTIGNCETCRFYSRINPDIGQCRRYAPRPDCFDVDDDGETIWPDFPEMCWDDWCGEWQQRQPQKGTP